MPIEFAVQIITYDIAIAFKTGEIKIPTIIVIQVVMQTLEEINKINIIITL